MKQSIKINSVKNARELGGYKAADGRVIKSGLLLRTAQLGTISQEDILTLREVYQVGDVIDFRMAAEIAGAEDAAIEGAAYHRMDVITLPEEAAAMADFDPKTLDLMQMLQLCEQYGMLNDTMYIGFLEGDMGKKGFGSFFRVLLNAAPDRAVLWHCTSGKDRTGLAAMLLMSALGVDEETVIADYLLTNEYNAHEIAATGQYIIAQGFDAETAKKASLIFSGVNESFMRTAMEHLKQHYGSVTGYIRDAMGITAEEIESLKEKYLQ